MSFTYSKDPANSDLDQVRYLIGDTEESSYILEDKEIQFEIDNEASLVDAAINAINGILAEIAQNADAVEAESVSADYSNQVNRYIAVKNQLKDRKSSQGKALKSLSSGSTLFDNGEPDKNFSIDQHSNKQRF